MVEIKRNSDKIRIGGHVNEELHHHAVSYHTRCLCGSEGSFAYREMQVVNVKKERKPPKAL